MQTKSLIRRYIPKVCIKLFREVYKERSKRDCRNRIKSMGDQIKLIIGAGSTNYKGWISTNIHELNILSYKDWKFLLNGKYVTNILSEHVWEHITLEEARLANHLCFRFLAKNGCLRIAVPDGYFPDVSYIEYVRPGGGGPGCEDHKVLYNYKLLSEELQKAGFVVDLLEYWDEHGKFHQNEWTPEERGMIYRSSRFDPNNSLGELKYTSLIIDAIKP